MEIDQFLSHVAKQENGCWLWTAYHNIKGYGVLGVGKGTKLAHRVSYEHFVGPIPNDKELDHICRVPACVCPDHLEAVTRRENRTRGRLSALNTKKTSHYAGVQRHTRAQKWYARIQIDKQHYALGLFTDEEEAYRAYLEAKTNFEQYGKLPTSLRTPRKTSRYTGVCWDKYQHKWIARIQIQNRKYSLGSFATEEEAHQAYFQASERKGK